MPPPKPISFHRRARLALDSTKAVLDCLAKFESRNVTFLDPAGDWPVVWARAKGAHVWDLDGRRYLDLTAAFGVAATGHANARVVSAARRQMGSLLHAMGDVHPHALKAELARTLSEITFERWTQSAARPGPRQASADAVGTWTRPDCAIHGRTIFGNSGFEAVEAALKTALLATGRSGVLAFAGAYHGLGYGALNPTSRPFFRSPFRSQLREFATFVPFPLADHDLDRTESLLRGHFAKGRIGAVLVEPVQGRGGIRIPPRGFLALLRRLCDEHEALLVLDEIYTGFGRTGRWFACEHEGVVPELICLGKALTGGFPLSACVGRAEVMDGAWPPSTGEAIHTSTFLGHPVGCAMALAQIREIEQRQLVKRCATTGASLAQALAALPRKQGRLRLAARSIGLMAGIELRDRDGRPAGDAVLGLTKAMLRRGFLALPEGDQGEVLGLTPPLTITLRQIEAAVGALAGALHEEAR